DCASQERTEILNKLVRPKVLTINIDHHVNNTNFGKINWVESRFAACGEMLFFLLKKFGPLSKEEAICLYTALMTDTGSFLYHLSPWSFSVAEQLTLAGANPEEIGRLVYFERPLSSIRLLGLCLRTIKFDQGTQACWARLTQAMYKKTQTKEADTERFVDYLRCVKEAAVVFLLKERADGVKVSLRSRGRVNVEKIARRFGGGGHRAAAGCLLTGIGIPLAEKKMLKVIKEEMANQ
ncbi:MAG: DHHA1 domain-containing protein, partial [Candidatus Omnitrophica bacterium]|nr:DHHA1 domain-containing protein [Candidatus Omnitrophota bacterium]